MRTTSSEVSRRSRLDVAARIADLGELSAHVFGSHPWALDVPTLAETDEDARQPGGRTKEGLPIYLARATGEVDAQSSSSAERTVRIRLACGPSFGGRRGPQSAYQ